MHIQKVIGENIQRIRVSQGLSQSEFCKKLGNMHQTRLSAIETGKAVITVKTLEKIAKTLSVPTIVLLNDISKQSLDLTKTVEAINLLPITKRKALLDIIEAYIQKEIGSK